MATEAGGFLPEPPQLRIPAHFSSSSLADSSHSLLPAPRSRSLDPNGRKAQSVKDYAEDQLLQISGKYERRFERLPQDQVEIQQSDEEDESVKNQIETNATHKIHDSDAEIHASRNSPKDDSQKLNADNDAYAGFAQTAKDLSRLIDVLWVSATPAIQIPFLLTLAFSAAEYVASFPFSASATFALFTKLDNAFSILLNNDGVNLSTYPSSSNGTTALTSRRFTMTEKVRLRGIVENTRIRVARQAGEADWEADEQNDSPRERGQRKRRHNAGSSVEEDDRGGKRRETEQSTHQASAANGSETANGNGGRSKAENPDDKTDRMLRGIDDNLLGSEYDDEQDESDVEDFQALAPEWEIRVARLYEKTIVALGPLMDAQKSIESGEFENQE